MKKKFTLLLSSLLVTGLVYDYNFKQAHTNGSGAAPGHSGSPADGKSCATVGCHVGGPSITNETGAFTSDIPATGYVGGETYNLSITLSKQGGSKFGFQLSPQDASGNPLGTLIAGAGSQIVGGNYLTHTFSSTTGSGSKTWDFQWTAPTAFTDPVTFYASYNFANADFSTSGDVILTDTYTVNASSLSTANAQLQAINVYPNPVHDQIHVAAIDVDEEIMITLYDVQGRTILTEQFAGSNRFSINLQNHNLKSGIYFMQLAAGNQLLTKRLLVD